MTMILNHPETEPGLEVKTWGFGDTVVYFGGRPVLMERFLDLALDRLTDPQPPGAAVTFAGHVLDCRDFAVTLRYVLTNTNLVARDPRLRFCTRVRRASIPQWWAPLAAEISALTVIPGYSGWSNGRTVAHTRLGMRTEEP